jgi:hypothetical protein
MASRLLLWGNGAYLVYGIATALNPDQHHVRELEVRDDDDMTPIR